MNKHFKAIAAMSLNRVIGEGDKIPWHLPEDFKWFRQMTMGNVVVLGRKTFESLGKPLPNRKNLILTRHPKRLINKHPEIFDSYREWRGGKEIENSYQFRFTKIEKDDKSNSSTFTAKDFLNITSLANKLNLLQLPVYRFIKDQLNAKSLEALKKFQDKNSDKSLLKRAIAEDFNKIIHGPLIYDSERFSGVVLRPKTRQMLTLVPEGDTLARLNRLLLEDAFPKAISRKQQTDILIFNSLELLNPKEFKTDIFICGGAQIYQQTLSLCSDLYLTLVKREVEGDAFFPQFEDKFKLVAELRDTPEFKILHYRHRSLTNPLAPLQPNLL